MSRRLAYILAPVLVWGLICGFAAAGAVLAVVHGNYLSLLMARAMLAGAAYHTALEWFRAEEALAERRSSIQSLTSAMPVPAEDLQ
ncbi:hypothetical protein EN794_004510 [Mesorhizobium sp. M00.F.Ca.ET.151.01.1.1]|nr:hypothetical protein EN842_05165 [bacterium M00.F.Ca.ET.199.01.1.1]TGT08736.1 hypothetical protein EN820_00350 [bacterium M00.F.Ca.ET.177.01.1.1]TGT66670.1 hypothetical protein EN813_000350 [Mesorhizobium sp. M00.F.Ca.ET.170.01.1.1]TGU15583.1 hypothetical protein EN806_00350 [bacterium M00.F.Ca.ET.163.01.1.1]TGU98309.1 hypothetical protein EN794_004510 [Mesorhizobium sp. M00.F.Ca.ET.151.01.1.1]TGV54172.1 hypothetical protein EN803_39815 [Mesorhizobium sp. M2D.F.Ca.ET.160.01.1.1]TGV59975.1 